MEGNIVPLWDRQLRGKGGGSGGRGQEGEESSSWPRGESRSPGGKKLGLSLPRAFSLFLHFALLFWNQTCQRKEKNVRRFYVNSFLEYEYKYFVIFILLKFNFESQQIFSIFLNFSCTISYYVCTYSDGQDFVSKYLSWNLQT